MNNNTNYKNTLIKMFLVENLGESIYKALSSKASNKKKISIYKRLFFNEVETANYIVNELKKMDFSVPRIRKIILKVVPLLISECLIYIFPE